MKGVIFNLLEEAVTRAWGADAWTDLVEASGVGGAYTSLGSYPDEEVLSLVDTAAALLDSDRDAVLRWFGEAAIPALHDKYGAFFEPHADTRNFLLSVNEIIHPEVRKLYPGAACPHFRFGEAAPVPAEAEGERRLLIGYRSPRRLCQLAHGFIAGASAHYGETVEIAHRACMGEGAEACLIDARWPAAAPAAAG